MMEKAAIARVLREIASLLELKGEGVYKVRAYERAARILEDQVDDLGALVREHRLTELEGIGKSLSDKIAELYLTGRLSYLDRLHGEIPRGVLELVQLQGVGPRRALMLLRVLDVHDPDELIHACEAHRVRKVVGFGPKIEERLLRAARRFVARRRGRPEGVQFSFPFTGAPGP